jgi:hypothetical protein
MNEKLSFIIVRSPILSINNYFLKIYLKKLMPHKWGIINSQFPQEKQNRFLMWLQLQDLLSFYHCLSLFTSISRVSEFIPTQLQSSICSQQKPIDFLFKEMQN